MPADRSISLEPASAAESPLRDDLGLRKKVGAYIIAAVPAFYELVPLPVEQLSQVLGDMVGQSGSEFEHASLIRSDGSAVGLVTWVEMETLGQAQRSATVGMLRHLDRSRSADFLRAVGEYSKQVEPVRGSGLYLSRIAVDESARGLGIGRKGVEWVISAAAGKEVWLHVAKDNDPAINLYKALGFEFVSDGAYASRAMIRRPHA